jgi:hypothetical protein
LLLIFLFLKQIQFAAELDKMRAWLQRLRTLVKNLSLPKKSGNITPLVTSNQAKNFSQVA